MRPRSTWFVLLLVGSLACSRSSERATIPSSNSETASQLESLLLSDNGPLVNPQACIESFEPGKDYFPAKARPSRAERFRIEYFEHYKKVTITPLADEPSELILLLCGTPLPEDLSDQDWIEIPARTVVTTSSTELPHLVQLGLLDRLVGHDRFAYASTPEVRERIAAGELVEVGSGSQLDLERLIDLAPDLLLIDSVGDPALQLKGKLRDLRIPVALVPSYLETSALGRAEWLLYTSLFFNREDRAKRLLERVFVDYESLAQIGRAAEDRPTALSSGPVGDTWWVPGGESYMAGLLADAGADYLWSEDPSAGSLALDIETVYERALEVDVWLHPNQWASLAEIRGVDARFADLRAFREGRVFGNDGRLNGEGGNDYWESGTARPDLVLRDLLLIFQPESLRAAQPDDPRQLIFHRRLDEEYGANP